MSQVTPQQVNDFSEHCVFIRSVYVYMMRLYRDSSETERNTLHSTAQWFFDDLLKVFREFVIVAACKVTDPAKDSRGNENFTVEMFASRFSEDDETFQALDAHYKEMQQLRTKILPARNKLGSHTDFLAASTGQTLGHATDDEWNQFWKSLAAFVSLLNEKIIGAPFDINAAGVWGDAENLIKALEQSRYFETLLNGSDEYVRDACTKMSLGQS